MIVTGSDDAMDCRAPKAGSESKGPKISLKIEIAGNPEQACSRESRSCSSAQQIREGEQSLIMPHNSAGACRAYNGTVMIPSAIMAMSRAAHRILFGARIAQRSP